MNMDWATRPHNADFDETYFERGRQAGVGWYENFHWMPERSHAEAKTFIRMMELTCDGEVVDDIRVVDFGCAKGFFVKAVREEGLLAWGIDVSGYALAHADLAVSKFLSLPRLDQEFDVGFCKDTLEHCCYEDIGNVLEYMASVCKRWLIIVPMAYPPVHIDGRDGSSSSSAIGKYRIPEYELDVTHIIREGEGWWLRQVGKHLHVNMAACWIEGLKDHWFHKCSNGNLMMRTG